MNKNICTQAGETLYLQIEIPWPAFFWPKIQLALNHPDDIWPEMSYFKISRTKRIYKFIPFAENIKPYEVRLPQTSTANVTRYDAFKGAIISSQFKEVYLIKPQILGYANTDCAPHH